LSAQSLAILLMAFVAQTMKATMKVVETNV
jgi:hypothetical protein